MGKHSNAKYIRSARGQGATVTPCKGGRVSQSATSRTSTQLPCGAGARGHSTPSHDRKRSNPDPVRTEIRLYAQRSSSPSRCPKGCRASLPSLPVLGISESPASTSCLSVRAYFLRRFTLRAIIILPSPWFRRCPVRSGPDSELELPQKVERQ